MCGGGGRGRVVVPTLLKVVVVVQHQVEALIVVGQGLHLPLLQAGSALNLSGQQTAREGVLVL